MLHHFQEHEMAAPQDLPFGAGEAAFAFSAAARVPPVERNYEQITADELSAIFQSDDNQDTMNAIKNIGVIASSWGPQKTIDDMICLLQQFADDDEAHDECTLALAEELGDMVPLIGGPDHAHLLLDVLEFLCGHEEAVVRESAVESLEKLLNVMPVEHIDRFFFTMVVKLASNEWFTFRSSACYLIPLIYPKVAESDQICLKALFHDLAHDWEHPSVGRAASQAMVKLAAVVAPADLLDCVLKELAFFYANKNKEEVRANAVQACVKLGTVVSTSDVNTYIRPIVMSACSDPASAVREMVVSNFPSVFRALGCCKELIDAFVLLTQDEDTDVTIAVALVLSEFAHIVGERVAVEQLMPAITSLVERACKETLAALANSLIEVSPLLKPNDRIQHLAPLFARFLKSDSPEARLNMISKLEPLQQHLDIHPLLPDIIESLKELSDHLNWRVRLGAIRQLVLLARLMGPDQFTSSLLSLTLVFLQDHVYSLRNTCIDILVEFIKLFGVDWGITNILPSVLQLLKDQNYQILPQMLLLATDSVVNVRFTLAKVFGSMSGPITQNSIELNILPCVRKMQNDKDTDVRFYAEEAVKLLAR